MPTPYESLSTLNRLIHEPARLAIVAVLSSCEEADFLFLLNVTGLTKGNLSSHLSKLERAGLVIIDKRYEGRLPVTYAKLTPEGRTRVEDYWTSLDTARASLKALHPQRT